MSDINYNKDRVNDGLALLKEYKNDLENVQELVDNGFSMIKTSKGYLKIKPSLLIKEKDVDQLLKNCALEFSNLTNNIMMMSSLIEKFDENELEKLTEPIIKNNKTFQEITEEEVKESIKQGFENNKEITQMFEVNLYNDLTKELNNLNVEEVLPDVKE